MKRKNTLWSLVLALVMVLGVFAPLGALASDAKPDAKTEAKTNKVFLHKILMDKEEIKARKVTLKDGSGDDAKSVSKVIIKKKVENKDVFYQNDGKTEIKGTETVAGTNLTWKQFTDAFDSGDEVFPSPKGGTHGINDEQYTGNEIKNIQNYFGAKALNMKDVYFAWKKDGKYIKADGTAVDDKYQNPESLKTKAEREDFLNNSGVLGGLTDANGTFEFDTSELPEGKYEIQEIKTLSTYKGANGEILAEQTAVPVEITLPVKNEDGVMNEVHVYPKNTVDKPPVDKFVVKDNKDVKSASFGVGEEHTWAIEAKIPTGFKDYKRFELIDTLDNALSYVKNQTITVQVGTKVNNEFKAETLTLTKGDDYTVSGPVDVNNESVEKGGKLTVKLTDAGIQKLAKKEYEGKLLRVTFKTIINEDAIMGKDIFNDVVLKYGHNPDSDGESKVEGKPKVYTGGKLFKKVVDGTTNPLEDAIFTIKHKKGGAEEVKDWSAEGIEDLTWTSDLFKANKTAIEKGKFAIKTMVDGKETYKPMDDKTTFDSLTDKTIYLRSAADGTFEIKGLEYSEYHPEIWDAKTSKVIEDQNTTIYNHYAVKEVKAPKDYALPSNNIFDFKVDKTSYYKTDTIKTAELKTPGDAEPKTIGNKKIDIPRTGGIGTMIFMVAGLALMGGAFIAMRKRSAEQA